MKNFKSATSAQGSCTQNSNFLSVNGEALPFSQKPTKNVIRNVFLFTIALLSCFVLSTSRAFAQDTVHVDINNHSYSLNDLTTSEEEIVLEFELGTEATPSNDVHGYEINISFSNWTGEATTLALNNSGSWIGGRSNGNMTQNWDDAAGTLTVGYFRNDEVAQDGEGFVLEIILTRPGGAFEEDESEAIIDGGLIIQDDLGLKRGPTAALSVTEEAFSFSTYPNPATSEIRIATIGATEGSYRIFDLQGQVMQSGEGYLPNSFDLTNMQTGIYWLKIATENGSETRKFTVMK